MGVPNTFVAGTTASASEVNANFTNIENYLGYQEITTTFTTTSVAGNVDVTNLTVTVTIPSGGRKIKITAFAEGMYTTGTGTISMSIQEGSGVLSRTSNETAGKVSPACCITVETPSAGSHTYKVTILQTGAGTAGLLATDYPAFILVEQI